MQNLILLKPKLSGPGCDERRLGMLERSTVDAKDLMSRVSACSEEPEAGSGSVRMSELVGPVVSLRIYVLG